MHRRLPRERDRRLPLRALLPRLEEAPPKRPHRLVVRRGRLDHEAIDEARRGRLEDGRLEARELRERGPSRARKVRHLVQVPHLPRRREHELREPVHRIPIHPRRAHRLRHRVARGVHRPRHQPGRARPSRPQHARRARLAAGRPRVVHRRALRLEDERGRHLGEAVELAPRGQGDRAVEVEHQGPHRPEEPRRPLEDAGDHDLAVRVIVPLGVPHVRAVRIVRLHDHDRRGAMQLHLGVARQRAGERAPVDAAREERGGHPRAELEPVAEAVERLEERQPQRKSRVLPPSSTFASFSRTRELHGASW